MHDLVHRAGTINQESLNWVEKKYLAKRYRELVRRIRDAGILVAAFFILGLDGDDISTFENLFEFIHESRIALPILNLLLPVPGMRVFERLKSEGRLLIRSEEDFLLNNPVYNTSCNRCLFLPKQMTVPEAESRYVGLARRLFSLPEILWRSAATNPLLAMGAVMNLELRRKNRAIAEAHARATTQTTYVPAPSFRLSVQRHGRRSYHPQREPV